MVHDGSPGVRLQTYATIHRAADERSRPEGYGRVVSKIDRVRTWWRTCDQMQAVDVVLAVVLAGFGVATVWSQELTDGMREPNGFAVVLVLVGMAPIAFRRRAPLLALGITSVAICWLVLAGFPEGLLPIAVLLLSYSVAASSPLRPAIAGLAFIWIAVAVLRLANAPGFDEFTVGANLAFNSIAWGAGLAVRARRETIEATVREAEERANVEQQRSARMIAEERLRLAQELHDVVAHSMSVIAVQAGVGAHVVDHRPDQAKIALEAISATARSTLGEMRRLLGVLRDEDGNRSHAPAPALSDIAGLVDDVRAAGIPVSLVVVGEPDAAQRRYRAVGVPHRARSAHQRHQARRTVDPGRRPIDPQRPAEYASKWSTTAEVQQRRSDRPDGRRAAEASDGGHGLIGMRERVELWGGELEVGPVDGGGYRVGATLPNAVTT
jgi:signal transduction histidine kinase